MTAKIKIDLSQGVIEAEGSEEFLKEIYSDFKERMKSPAKDSIKSPSRIPLNANEDQTETNNRTSKKKNKVSKIQLTLIKDLDLSRKGDIPSLKEFHSQYKASTNFKNNLIFAYYLLNIREMQNVGSSHIFTCYRHLSIKVPQDLVSSLRDTAKDKGWLDTSSLNDIKVPIAGINYIEHEMQKSDTPKEK